MCRNQRKLLLAFALLFVFALPLFAQDDTDDLEYWNQVAQELTLPTPNLLNPFPELNLNLNLELKNAPTMSEDSTTSEPTSMTAWELFDRCEEIVTSLESRLQNLSLYSKNLETDLSLSVTEIKNLRNDLANTRQALISNKEDTGVANALAGEFYAKAKALEERVAYAERRNRNATIYSEVVTPIPGLILMTAGFIEMGNGNTDLGWNLVKAGAITLVGMEVIYNGGRWIFKVW